MLDQFHVDPWSSKRCSYLSHLPYHAIILGLFSKFFNLILIQFSNVGNDNCCGDRFEKMYYIIVVLSLNTWGRLHVSISTHGLLVILGNAVISRSGNLSFVVSQIRQSLNQTAVQDKWSPIRVV